jgi:hypothetical protein
MLKAKGLFFGHCSYNGFILGSSPIIKIGRVGSELSDPAVEVWLPISPHVCAVLGGAPNDGQLVWMTRPQVRKINLIIETNSSVFAGNSKPDRINCFSFDYSPERSVGRLDVV